MRPRFFYGIKTFRSANNNPKGGGNMAFSGNADCFIAVGFAAVGTALIAFLLFSGRTL